MHAATRIAYIVKGSDSMDGAMISTNAGFGTYSAGADRTNAVPTSSTDGKQAAVGTGRYLETESVGTRQNAPVQKNRQKEAEVSPAANAAAVEASREQLTGRDVIATDEDGDTLAVTKTASADGNVLKTRDAGADGKDTARTENITAEREAAAKSRQEALARQQAADEARQQAAEEIRLKTEEAAAEEEQKIAETAQKEAAKPEQLTSFTGITDQQLQADYIEGKISRYDYDSEIASREKVREESREEFSQAAEENAAYSQKLSDSKRVMEAVSAASAEKGSDGLTGNDRLDAAENFVTDAGAQAAAGSAFGQATVNTGDSTVKAEQQTTKQETDSLLRGEERIQWQFQ